MMPDLEQQCVKDIYEIMFLYFIGKLPFKSLMWRITWICWEHISREDKELFVADFRKKTKNGNGS